MLTKQIRNYTYTKIDTEDLFLKSYSAEHIPQNIPSFENYYNWLIS